MSRSISLAEVRKDRLERFCTKYNWVFPICNYDLKELHQDLPEEDVDYYCNLISGVVSLTNELPVLDWETGTEFR